MRALSILSGLSVLVLALIAGPGCGNSDPNAPNRTPIGEKWYLRANTSYRGGDLDDANVAVESAMKASPQDMETRILAARIALARLDYAQAIKLTENIQTNDAKTIRGRALWYSGDMDRAADDLEDLLRDPSVKDNWARDVAKLARRGQGRHPFQIEGGVVASVEMPQAGPALVVPCELEGERILALVATAMGELMIDSSTRAEPAWVNLKFGDRLEVKDVPALTHDLSAISKQLGAPIKALIGVNALRHMHVTFDRRGSQFVVRKSDPAPPPDASRVPLFYVRGGGMMMRAQVSKQDDGNALLFVDSSQFYPIALDDQLLKHANADMGSFQPQQGVPASWKLGYLPYFKLGTLDLPQMPAMSGVPLAEFKSNFDVDLGGVVGAGLLSAFRVTFADDGRFVWMEMDPSMLPENQGRGQQPPPQDQAPPPTQQQQLTPPKGAPAPPASAKPATTTPPPATKPEGKGAAK